MRVRFHPEARADLRAAKAFYRKRSPAAASTFAREVDAAVDRIAANPTRYPLREHGTRELVLPWRFPYTVVYLVLDGAVVIVAIAHQSRAPEYWRERVTG